MIAEQNKPKKVMTGFSLDKDVVQAIDAERGLAKRSTYVNDILRYALLESNGEPNICENQAIQ